MVGSTQTQVISADPRGVEQAAALLAKGALVAFPTETVYGLGADARDDTAVAGIFAAKNRPQFNPLIVHVRDLDHARSFAEFGDAADRLADAFWPGALTLVVPMKPGAGLSPLVSAGLPSVALRVPAHPVAQALLTAFDGPVAAPSANPSGRVSPTRADHVLDGLNGRIAAILDGGACDVGVESTIVGCTDTPTLLRPGGIPVEAIEACLGQPLARAAHEGPITAPGQLSSHYAPDAPLRLNADHAQPGELWLGFGHGCEGAALNLSPSGDLLQAAANLFHYLRQMDEMSGGKAGIAVAPIPETGLGLAINDRLRRAAAPRP